MRRITEALLDANGDPVVINGRPDFQDHDFGVTSAKKFPPYVFSVSKNAALIHKVVSVEMRWYAPNYHNLVRLKRPRMIANTACGEFRFLSGDKTRTCLVPAPDALLCGRCHGEVATFGKKGKATQLGITRQQANVKLGCVVKGY